MKQEFFWAGSSVKFETGDTLAAALLRAGIRDLGTSKTGVRRCVFCGIGQCQNCLVEVEGLGTTEACLYPCDTGLKAWPTGRLGGENDT